MHSRVLETCPLLPAPALQVYSNPYIGSRLLEFGTSATVAVVQVCKPQHWSSAPAAAGCTHTSFSFTLGSPLHHAAQGKTLAVADVGDSLAVLGREQGAEYVGDIGGQGL